MRSSPNSAEKLFAQAIDIPAGAARNQFVAEHCADNPSLRAKLESLLRGHEQAGDFLLSDSEKDPAKSNGASAPAPGATSILSAAACAAEFLRATPDATQEQAERFLAALPQDVRTEARERIKAAHRIRQWRTQPRQPLSSSPQQDDTLPRLPGFRVEHKLGEGSLGAVYAAHDQKLNRRGAIKVIRRGAAEQVRRRVLDEARAAAALSDPCVVTVFSVLDETDPPAIVMELVEGFPLDRFAAQLNFQQKAQLLREVARGLAAAHAHGLIHRDLKPENVIVGPDMRPRILDFGLALSLEEAGRQGRGFEGTPLYASPEQALGKSLDAASDVFSFGSLMFKVLTGKAPFAGNSITEVLEAIAATAPPFLREVALGVPEDLQAICLACLAWKSADRPTAEQIALELGRFLVGEPVRFKPKLYEDLLRRSISEQSSQAQAWESQSIISRDERDALEIVHRRLLADEDHWIIDARRITVLQTILSGATWLGVVATILTVWMLRQDLAPPWRWLLPTLFTATLFAAGLVAYRQRENLAAATFLAGAAIAIAPCTLAFLAELHLFAIPPPAVAQLFPGTFTNQQIVAATFIALALSVFGLCRLKMTGFAWTTATLIPASYLSLLLTLNWLDQKPEIQALWCLPLAAVESIALFLEKKGRVRWTMPFHMVALAAIVAGLDVMALNGPTLKMLRLSPQTWAYFDDSRLKTLSFVLNGLIFLSLMVSAEKSASLDLRRAGKLLEILAIVHTLSALFANALQHRNAPYVRLDVWLYLALALLFVLLAPFRSRWRLLVGGLAGCGLVSYLFVDLGLVPRKTFIVALGFTGLFIALGTFIYMRRSSRFPTRRFRIKQPTPYPRVISR